MNQFGYPESDWKLYKSKVGGKTKAKKIKKIIQKGMTAKQKKKIKIKIV